MDRTNYTIHALTPQRLGDYLAFFDGPAFADNPGWARCYCRCYTFPHHEARWSEATAAQNRAEVSGLVAERKMHGFLAYSGDRVVGWCHASPRSLVSAIQHDEPLPDADRIGSVVCFVVASSHRGRGLAKRLLMAACDDFRAQGLGLVEAYPRRDVTRDDANHHGPLSMYLAAGFEIVEEDDEGGLLVRKRLA